MIQKKKTEHQENIINQTHIPVFLRLLLPFPLFLFLFCIIIIIIIIIINIFITLMLNVFVEKKWTITTTK